MEEALEKNPSIIECASKNIHRDEFMKQIDSTRIDKLIKHYCRNNATTKVKIHVKSMLHKLIS